MITTARRAALIANLLWAVPSSDVIAGPAVDQSLRCTAAEQGFGYARLACPIQPAPATATFRVTATFAGVHDDSSAALVVDGPDGQPIACAPGGQSRLQGEENGDTLACAFALPADSTARELTLRLVWHHADPSSFALRRE